MGWVEPFLPCILEWVPIGESPAAAAGAYRLLGKPEAIDNGHTSYNRRFHGHFHTHRQLLRPQLAVALTVLCFMGKKMPRGKKM